MLDRLVIENLRRNKAFDAGLKSASRVDKLADEFADAILFETDPKKRAATIKRLGEEIVSDSRKVIIPAAERIGRENAVSIIGKTPAPTGINLANETERRTALFEGKRRTEQRLAIIRESVDAEGKKLDAKLARYWLEPAEGTKQDKLERLREIHNRLEKRREDYEDKLADFHLGKTDKRPSKPDLDYLSEMTEESKKEIRTQARRVATDAEVAVFKSRGHKFFVWIVPNGHSACPDCRKRASVKLTLPEWERLGRPGSGLTVCGSNCFCMLIPVESVAAAPALLTKIETRELGPMTNAEQLKIFNANRLPTATAADAKTGAPVRTPTKPSKAQVEAPTKQAKVIEKKPLAPDIPYRNDKKKIDSVMEFKRQQAAQYLKDQTGKTPSPKQVDELLDKAEKQARKLLEGSRQYIAAKPDSLEKILETGRFKSQFETKTSGGSFSPNLRTKAESDFAAVPEGIDPKLRPIYGYVTNNPDGHNASTDFYGILKCRLKPSVAKRSTVTFGDSLSAMAERGKPPRFLADPIGHPTAASIPSFESESFWEGKGIKDIVGYVEHQVHGGVNVSDIEVVTFPDDWVKTNADQFKRISNTLKSKGIGVEVRKQGKDALNLDDFDPFS